MSIPVVCMGCSARYSAPPEAAGKSVVCPKCGRQIHVPGGPAKPAIQQQSAETPTSPPPPVTTQAVTPSATVAGTRRRMYVFERAYADYADRLVSLARGLKKVCGDVWRWFSRGPGAAVIELILRAAIVLSGIVLAILYVRYEVQHGRGFSFSMALSMGFILLYVWVLLWGWKAPIHLVAKSVTGITATASVGVLGGLAVCLIFTVFGGYMLGLLLLTALSFLVFLPMRGIHHLWLLWRRITYQCPDFACPSKANPIYVCDCGAVYNDLMPSFYGIFYHTCRHADRDVKLPTMDFMGRNKLTRLCRGCKRQLKSTDVGELEVRPIAVVGGPSAGKSVFLCQAIDQLAGRLGTIAGNKVKLDSQNGSHPITIGINGLKKGRLPAKTAGADVEAYGLALRLQQPKSLRTLLYLFDAPGEMFSTVQRLSHMHGLQNLHSVILLVDPFALDSLRNHAQQQAAALKPSSLSFRDLVPNVISVMRQMKRESRSGRWDIPVAVVVAKADSLPMGDFPFLTNLAPVDGRQTAEANHLGCRDALTKLGEGGAVRLLEQHFSNVRYFACSALGRSPASGGNQAFVGRGVVEPFHWLLGLNGSAPAKAKPQSATLS